MTNRQTRSRTKQSESPAPPSPSPHSGVEGASWKIHDYHRERLAIVYVRQSSPRQVEEHHESTDLQYGLTRRAEQYGFLRDQPDNLSLEDVELIEKLAANIPRLWNEWPRFSTDHKLIVRYLIDRVVVRIQDISEVVNVTIQWQGGFENQHELSRSVARFDQLKEFERLKELINSHVTTKDAIHDRRQVLVPVGNENDRNSILNRTIDDEKAVDRKTPQTRTDVLSWCSRLRKLSIAGALFLDLRNNVEATLPTLCLIDDVAADSKDAFFSFVGPADACHYLGLPDSSHSS